MKKKILVIGGTRFFGIRLVRRLLDAGHDVTIATRGLTGDRFGERIRRIRVDRRELGAMTAAFAAVDGYDVVFDQMCYGPGDAEIALAALRGRVARYVMASTIEVYDRRYGAMTRPLVEDDADLAPAAERGEPSYAEGKRQAEAVLARAAAPATVRVRIGHVLAGPEDFTGRLASYVQRARAGEPLRHAVGAAATSFISVDGICDLLAWAGDATLTGPINAASHAWSAVELHDRVAAVIGRPARFAPVAGPVRPTELSPFDYPARFDVSTARAQAAGYRFDPDDGWLDDAIRRHAVALAA